MELSTGISASDVFALIISLIALGLSSRALWISRTDRKQDRREQALRMIGEIEVDIAGLVGDIFTARFELGKIRSEWQNEMKESQLGPLVESIETADQGVQIMKEAIEAAHASTGDLGSIMEIVQNSRAKTLVLQRVTRNSIEQIRLARNMIKDGD